MLRRLAVLALGAALLIDGCGLYQGCRAQITTVAQGLTNPRGLTRGPDGRLYVAEAGVEATGGQVSRLEPDGRVTTLVSGLPHSVNAGTEDVGASGVAFRGDQLFVALGEGSGALGSTVARYVPDGQALAPVADLAAFELSHNPDDQEIESNPFALAYEPARDRLLVTDAAGNSLLAVTPSGDVSTVAVWRDGVVPTGIALGPEGSIYVTLLGRFPHPPGNGRLDRVRRDGLVETIARGLSMPIGVGVGPDGELDVLEFASALRTTPRLEFVPRSGRLVRIADGRRDVVVDGLAYPTALLIEPDGTRLISAMGAMGTRGTGSIVRVATCAPRRQAI